MSRRPWLRLLAALAVALGLSGFLLWRSGVDDLAGLQAWGGRLVGLVAGADRGGLALFFALSTAGLFARALRYRWLLPRELPFLPLLLVTAIRNFLVDLVPARAGSLSYIYLLTARLGLPIEPVLSSFVLTFVYDLLAMTLLVALALALQFATLEGGEILALGIALFGAIVTAVFAGLVPGARFGAGLLRRLPIGGRLGSAAAKLADGADATAAEMATHSRPAHVALLLALSFGIRLLKYGALWSLLLALLVPAGWDPAALPFWKVVLGMIAPEISATLPIHGLAGFGSYEFAWALGFEHFLGFDPETATLTGFGTHALSQLHDYSLGLAALGLLYVLTRKRDDPTSERGR